MSSQPPSTRGPTLRSVRSLAGPRPLTIVATIFALAVLATTAAVPFLGLGGVAVGPSALATIPSGAGLPAGTNTVAGNLTGSAGPAIASTSSAFWSIDLQTNCARCVATNASVNTFLNATPFDWVRYGMGTDACNLSANLKYDANGVSSPGCAFNITSLKAWCSARTPACHALLTLPGENNNSAEDGAIAQWITSTLGFHPDFWAIGNEPTGWTHYGIPWAKWSASDTSAASPLDYAFDVKAGIAAVKAVDPSAHFIGIEAACSCNTVWFQDVAKIDGSSISAIAYHSYPSDGAATPTLNEFLQPLSSSKNLSSSMASVRSSISGICPNCTTLPIFVNEYNAGPGAGASSLGGSYANAEFLATSVIQALRANVSQLTVFNLQTASTSTFGFSMMNGKGAVGPTGLLFSDVLEHLAVGTVVQGGVATSLAGVWSVLTRNATADSNLVVNLNLTHSLRLSMSGGISVGALGNVYQWGPSQTSPNATWGPVNASYLIPPQGIFLITIPRGHALGPVIPAQEQSFPHPMKLTRSTIAYTVAPRVPGLAPTPAISAIRARPSA